jgi:predicted nucleic acid-binding protein
VTEENEGATAAAVTRGLLDTSVFVARETGRPVGPLPDEWAVSVVTVAELRLGVLLADDPAILAQRLRTLVEVQTRLEPLAADTAVAGTFAELVAEARRAGRRPKAMDAWIAATAVTHGLPLYTQDGDFDGLPLVQVVRV